MLCLPAELLAHVASFTAPCTLPALAATCRALYPPARRHQVWRVQGMKGLFNFLALLLKVPTIKNQIRALDFDPREKVGPPAALPATAAIDQGGQQPTAPSPQDGTPAPVAAQTQPAATVTTPPPHAAVTATTQAAPTQQMHAGGPINDFAFQLLALCLQQLPELRHLSLALLPTSLPAQLELVRAISTLDLLDSLLLSETRHLLGGAFLCWPAWVALLESLDGNTLTRLSAPVELHPADHLARSMAEVRPLPVVRIKNLRLQLKSFTDAHLDRLSAALYADACLIVVQLTGASPYLSTANILRAHAPQRFSPRLKLLGLPIDASSSQLGQVPFLTLPGMKSVVARGKNMLFTVLGEQRQVGEMVRGLVGEGTKGKGWVETMWIQGQGMAKEEIHSVEHELSGRGVELKWTK